MFSEAQKSDGGTREWRISEQERVLPGSFKNTAMRDLGGATAGKWKK